MRLTVSAMKAAESLLSRSRIDRYAQEIFPLTRCKGQCAVCRVSGQQVLKVNPNAIALGALLKRDKLNLDIFWLKDESLDDVDSLPPA